MIGTLIAAIMPGRATIGPGGHAVAAAVASASANHPQFLLLGIAGQVQGQQEVTDALRVRCPGPVDMA